MGRYREKKKEYRELCGRKRKEENERWEKKAAEAKKENEVWSIVNREKRRKDKRISMAIEMKEWKEHFMGGVERRIVNAGGEGGGSGGEAEENMYINIRGTGK